MLQNFFKVAVRHLARSKGYSLINAMSLVLGIACCLLILLYIRDELSYDRYHDRAERIFRVISDERRGDVVVRSAEIPVPVASFMRDDYTEVEEMVRFIPPGNAWMIRYGEKGFYERNFYLADSTVFDVFTVPLMAGNPRTALTGNDRVVLSESTARKYFGNENPIGKILEAEGAFQFEVTGVMEDLPANTHLGFDILASFRFQEAWSQNPVDTWDRRRSYSYVLLREDADPDDLEARLPEFVEKYAGNRYVAETSSLTLSLQPVTDIHLHSRLTRELTPNSDVRYVYFFSSVAVFIFIIACFTYMNLVTARFAGRAREIGLRKIFGAHRGALTRQFLSESLVMSGLAVCIALVLVPTTLPWFNMVTGKALDLDVDTAWFILGAAMATGVAAGLVSGSYPALYLSALKPVQVLQRSLASGTGSAGFRGTLVIGQCSISIALVICTGVVFSQLDYIRTKNLGFDAGHVVAVPLTTGPATESGRIYKELLQKSPYVISATVAYMPPGHRNFVLPITVRMPGRGEQESLEFLHTWTDEDFIETCDIKLAAGRYFDSSRPGDWIRSGAAVLNETALKKLGFETPEEAVGGQFERIRERRQGYDVESTELRTIVGVVRDFHYMSLHAPIAPLMIFPDFEGSHVMVKVDGDHTRNGLAAVEDTWKQLNPETVFEYTFVDESVSRLYDAERRFGRIFFSFAVLAVLIACLGLVGLSSFTAERRRKEIGVRKVLGASGPSLVALLTLEYFRLVIAAIVVAWPVAYFAMNAWLGGFAYRVDLDWTTFILAGVLAMAIALLTVSFQAVRAAAANPVEALRME